MIYTTKGDVKISNDMGLIKAVFTHAEWENVKKLFEGLTDFEILDLRHSIRYPSKKTKIRDIP